MISDQKKKKFSKHSNAMGYGFLQLIKSLYYINQTLCRVIFLKPFLSAGKSEHEPKTQH